MKLFNVKRYGPRVALVMAAGVLIVTFQNCGDVRVGRFDNSSYASSDVNVETCTENAKVVKSNIKFLFVFDRSGSNLSVLPQMVNGQAMCGDMPLVAPATTCPGTDPLGHRRFDPVLNFAQNYTAQDDFIHWGMINFGSDATNVLLDKNYINPRSSFTTDNAPVLMTPLAPLAPTECTGTGFELAVCREKRDTQAIDSVGYTNYLLGLDEVYSVISADLEEAKRAPEIIGSMYVIFFVTDGAPYVPENGNLVLQNSQQILAKLTELQQLRKDNPILIENIQFNTAYYYENPDVAARTLLQNMAATGRGNYLEFGSGAEIDFSQFTVPTRTQKFDLRETFITNANTVWKGSKLLQDRDADLISDEEEFELGSDFEVADSDGNGVSDGIEKIVEGTPCGAANCAQAGRRNYGARCSGQTTSGGVVSYPDRDYDLLNDCEEQLLGSDALDFDSNHDGVPDSLALKVGLNVINGSSNDLNLNPDNDDLTNYYEIKRNSPLRYPNDEVVGLKLMKYKFSQTTSNSAQNCYHYGVDDLATAGEGNKIRVYVLESSALISSKLELKIAEKEIYNGSVSVTERDFRSRTGGTP